jgi:6-pyruvoyltetrahydropterin/6-carboxytetrahydropterin synthase
MLMDFGDLKRVLRTVLTELDHTDLNEHPAFKGSSPSSENIARFIWGKVNDAIDLDTVTIASVTVNESDTASARYEPGDE